MKWYEEHKTINLICRDLVDYCVSDVDILTAACLKFREQLISTTNVCPFTDATTIASTCNKIYRRNFLKPGPIGIIPKNDYRWKDRQSKIVVEWLLWMEREKQINITHAAKNYEMSLHGARVDGYCTDTNEIFEFQGCYYHGWAQCSKFGRDEPIDEDPTQTLNLRYEKTLSKIEKLKSFGYTVIEKWGDVISVKKGNKILK